jgi:hypothetical protein
MVMGGSQWRHGTNGWVDFSTGLFVRFDADGNELLQTTLTETGVPDLILPLAGGDMLMVTYGQTWFDPRRSGFFRTRMSLSRVSADGALQWTRLTGPRGWRGVRATRFDPLGRLLLGGYQGLWQSRLFLTEVNADTGKIRNRTFAIPRASRGGRYDFAIDEQSNFYFLAGDGTSWPNVILTKFRGLPL